MSKPYLDHVSAEAAHEAPTLWDAKEQIEKLTRERDAWKHHFDALLKTFCPAENELDADAAIDRAKDLMMLRPALEESLKLQAHYAELLNMHDGGKRRCFATVDEWIARLKETRKL